MLVIGVGAFHHYQDIAIEIYSGVSSETRVRLEFKGEAPANAPDTYTFKLDFVGGKTIEQKSTREFTDDQATITKSFFFEPHQTREIIEHAHVALAERGGELGLDIGIERGSVHGPIENPGRRQSVAAQTGDEGLRAPVAEGRLGPQPLALATSATQPRHLCVDRSRIDEDQPMRLEPHAWLAFIDPNAPRLTNVRACALRGHQRFFYM